jgi:hypothetical protein
MKVSSSEIRGMELFQGTPRVTFMFDAKLDDGNKTESGKILVPCQHYETN